MTNLIKKRDVFATGRKAIIKVRLASGQIESREGQKPLYRQ